MSKDHNVPLKKALIRKTYFMGSCQGMPLSTHDMQKIWYKGGLFGGMDMSEDMENG